ncbi:UNVERIFIED_CONTAM: protein DETOXIFICATION 46, chloroplastic [Sesamum calycinum]|uniref:Protein DETOXIFICATION n=1 Tax=Sesamum calycinum TaxID=2727403 RepID=A0AAW2PLH9_9LAMI
MNFEALTHPLHFHCPNFRIPNRKFNPNSISPKSTLRIISCRNNRSVSRNCGYPSRGVDNPIQIFPTEDEKEEAAVVEKMQMLGEVSENIREELSESGSLWDQITEIVKFSGPVVGLWLCGPLMSLIDTAVVGQSSSVELAALGPGTVFSDCASYLFMFLSIATSNLVATSLARQDKSEVQHQISILLFVGLVCGIMMLLFTKFYGRWALTAFAGANNADIITAANTYVQIRGLVWPVWLVGSVAQSASLGMKDSWGPIKALAVASAINGVGDIVLCKFLGFGIAGAAWATMVSQVVAAYMMIDALNKKGYNGFAISIPSPNEFLQIFLLAAPAFVAILSKVRQLLKSLVFIGALSGLILGSIGISLPWLFPQIFSSDPEVIQEAGRDLKFLGISMTGIACLGTLLVKLYIVVDHSIMITDGVSGQSLFTVLLRRLTLPNGILYSEEATRYEHGKLKTV